jgi:SAM-dependent methyltransferase
MMSFIPPFPEPLDESHQQAQACADAHCKDCAWYHGFWQYLRLIGLGKTLSGQSSWFIDQIRAVRHQPDLSILIMGCADYSAFAHVIKALELEADQHSQQPRIVAIDLCETPLLLNQFLAERTGVKIVGHQTDALQYQPEATFDLVFTSSFMGYFDPRQRLDLFKQCHSWLKPGGRLVFSNRLRSGDENAPLMSSDREIEQSLNKAIEMHRRLNMNAKMDEAVFTQRLRAFLKNIVNYPVNSAQTMVGVLQDAGFEKIDSEIRLPDLPQQAVQAQITGARLAEKTDYVCVVAHRSVEV